jgi:hypothetical protein
MQDDNVRGGMMLVVYLVLAALISAGLLGWAVAMLVR